MKWTSIQARDFLSNEMARYTEQHQLSAEIMSTRCGRFTLSVREYGGHGEMCFSMVLSTRDAWQLVCKLVPAIVRGVWQALVAKVRGKG